MCLFSIEKNNYGCSTKKEREIFSEADLLADLNDYNSHADELAVVTSAELGE
ncbi:hypothetical protein [Xenorhabdus nematophila]|uniref:hypothetical protein n=1 Tax=Xenorhabdus nematophila TaxID=628 RepID=UPI000542E281|nr:hypothetical protein [Xenorhabdus nematophila]CEF29116.1 putative counterpart of the neighbouring MazF-like protein [Xenorhabdus nematophila str. Websteri]CEF29594.1 putative counterpart of the neighbouring MazF-like protein [Xenorhabdus nematophila str. Websteri]